MTRLVADTFRTWTRMPDHLIVQSWSVTDTGLLMTPSNLDEERPYSHTWLLLDAYRHLRGVTGPSTGQSVPRVR
jgi:hypothetical protein